MADISKININDSSEYNIKDTTARDGLTDRPTSFVGTRSEWNALPVATQVKYSLVNLIGEGVYKNNGTGLDDIANTGGASKNFQGTIEEWNALTTEQKKAYDHASIPDSLDGNVTFPASKVIMTGGENVEEALEGVKNLHVHEFDVSNIAVNITWGGIKTSNIISLPISDLGLTTPPEVISLLFNPVGITSAITFKSTSIQSIDVYLFRGDSATVSGKVIVILRY